MNAGSRETWMGGVTETVTVFDPQAGLRRLRGHEIAWEYRGSGLPDEGVILECVLSLVAADRDRIQVEMERSLDRRKQTQPLGVPSAGSVFRNPEGDSAGHLIETAGLKGARIGGAAVSTVHANFIVNDGGASAADVAHLMSMIQTNVRDRYHVELEPEIRFLGSFDAA
jgi:UDP-N-acetylmuramate dehydrogenase